MSDLIELIEEATTPDNWCDDIEVISIGSAALAINSIVEDLVEIIENLPDKYPRLQLQTIVDRWCR